MTTRRFSRAERITTRTMATMGFTARQIAAVLPDRTAKQVREKCRAMKFALARREGGPRR